MAKTGGHDTWVEANEDEGEVWAEAVAEFGDDWSRGRGGRCAGGRSFPAARSRLAFGSWVLSFGGVAVITICV
jgi:hypothetical protein